MPSDNQYALMAGAAYTSTRTENNRIPWPQAQGWFPFWPPTLYATLSDLGFSIEANSIRHSSSGFEARVFSNGSETVIAYAGTDLVSWDMLANVELAAGAYSEQFERAAMVYAAVKQSTDQQISFTGHSLGGGLAALMGVYFDKAAVTFDQAPFFLAAVRDHHASLQAALSRCGFATDADLAGYAVNFTQTGPQTARNYAQQRRRHQHKPNPPDKHQHGRKDVVPRLMVASPCAGGCKDEINPQGQKQCKPHCKT